MTQPELANLSFKAAHSQLLDRESFFQQADRIASFLLPGNIAIIFARVFNLRQYNSLTSIEAGDEVLETIMDALPTEFPRGLIAQYSSSSFLVMTTTDSLTSFPDDLNQSLKDQSLGTDSPYVKVGICLNTDGLPTRENAERARFACNSIRDDETRSSRLFDAELAGAYARRAYIINSIDVAIARGEIHAHYQPIVRVITGKICEVEVLSRWDSIDYGTIMPGEFVPLLEEHRLIHKLDCHMIRLACQHWREAHDERVAVPFGINLSRLDFELCDVFGVVMSALDRYQVPIDACHIEVTESALSTDNGVLWKGVQRFRDAGFTIYMDDFGSGYSSIKVLEDFDFDVVKIDMTLLEEVEFNERSRVITSDVINMTKRLKMQTLCEGVETEEQLMFLRHVGCEKAQGYYFAKPMHRKDLADKVASGALELEGDEDRNYFNMIGQVNLADGSQAAVQGVESISYMGIYPVAIFELLGKSIRMLTCNTAFTRLMHAIGAKDYSSLTRVLGSGSAAELGTKIAYAATKAKITHEEESIDFMAGGSYLSLSFSHIASVGDHNAFLCRAVDVGRQTPILRTASLERSLRWLYAIYKRIDLFDLDDGTYLNLYVNSPIYKGNITEGNAREAIQEFVDLVIHPDDREDFLEFYDPSTAEQRIRASSKNHMSRIIRTLNDDNRYTDQVYTLIPFIEDGKRKVLSSLRDADQSELHCGPGEAGGGLISDEVLLTGVLEVCDRQIFWKDAKRRFMGANQAFLDYYGFESVNEILGKTDEDMGWHADPGPFKSDEECVLQGDIIRNAIGSCQVDGQERTIRANKRPLYREGEVVGLVGYFSDITDELERPGDKA